MAAIRRRGLLGLLAAAGGSACAGSALGRSATTSAGASDLTGVWTNAWYTKLERPKAFTTLVVTPAQAAAYETPRHAHQGELISEHDSVGQDESEFPDNGPGLARIRGEIRSSWITDPPDGRIPWTEAAKTRLYIHAQAPDRADNVEDREIDERCLVYASATAPLLNAHDTNLVQIVQTPGAVVLVSERLHQTRIIPIAQPGGPDPTEGALPGWVGVSVGRWEGATLVVETTRLRPGDTKLDDDIYLSDHAKVVERFTRTGPKEIGYRFEVTDPTLFTQTWRGEMVFRPAEGQMFEFACHEGNYSLPGILAAARAAERGAKGAGK
ncbi:MAG TPA: hypothetical protein VHW05_14075 [Phenylobacterium sp.]|jgi:hypothetical protein|nr:hypothetical protein [Phenylobacterium sp.]